MELPIYVVIFVCIAICAVAAAHADTDSAALACGVDRCIALRLPSIALSPLAPPGQTKAPSPPQEYKAQLNTMRINKALWWSKFENDDADREC